MSVTVVIPHIDIDGVNSRKDMLQQAIDSVYAQSAPELVHDPIVITDTYRQGGAWSRAQGIVQVTTKWLTILDDDDYLLPRHHAALVEAAEQTGADVVYGKTVMVGTDRTLSWDLTFDEAKLRVGSYIPGGGSLIRTELLQKVGLPQADSVRYAHEMAAHDDWAMYIALLDGGAKFHHIEEDTYCWRQWAWHTGGLGNR